MAFLWSLWPLNLNRWLFQLKLLHMIYISWKNYKILKFWVLDFGFGLQNFFWPLKVFLRSLVSNKSSGVQKSYVWAIFHAKQFLLLIFHSGSLWYRKWLQHFFPRDKISAFTKGEKYRDPCPLIFHAYYLACRWIKCMIPFKFRTWCYWDLFIKVHSIFEFHVVHSN